jgi:ribosomal protein S12 methylthiotransferase accessory factor
MTGGFFDLGGTVRARAARDTLAQLAPLLPRFGITRLVAQEGLAGIAIPVTICFRPNARGYSSSQGKGVTRELADVSAVMESIELFHAERLRAPDVIAPVAWLRAAGRRFIDPAQLIANSGRLVSAAVYNDNHPIEWLALAQPAGGAPILVPRSYLDLDRTGPYSPLALALDPSSNGLASGNTLDEAVVHGLYELIERHCFTEYSGLDLAARRARSVDLATISGAPHLGELMQRLDHAGLALAVRAIHGPLGIPAFRAKVTPRDPGDRTPGTVGFGAHFVPEVAMSRAITETIQGRVTKIAGARDDFYPYTYHHINAALDPVFDAALDPAPAAHEPAGLAWSAIPRPPRFASFREVLGWTLAALERHGFTDTCFLDQRRAELGNIPIVSVVSPHLRFDRHVFHRIELE